MLSCVILNLWQQTDGSAVFYFERVFFLIGQRLLWTITFNIKIMWEQHNKLISIKQYLQSKINRRLYRAIWDYEGINRTTKGPNQVVQSHTGPYRTPLGNTGPSGTMQNQMETNIHNTRSLCTRQEHTGAYETIWDHTGPYRAIRGHKGPCNRILAGPYWTIRDNVGP